jgi:hypothetical protein
MAGLSFCDLDDANVFYTKITTQEVAPKKKPSKKKGKKQLNNATLHITLLSYCSRGITIY